MFRWISKSLEASDNKYKLKEEQRNKELRQNSIKNASEIAFYYALDEVKYTCFDTSGAYIFSDDMFYFSGSMQNHNSITFYKNLATPYTKIVSISSEENRSYVDLILCNGMRFYFNSTFMKKELVSMIINKMK